MISTIYQTIKEELGGTVALDVLMTEATKMDYAVKKN